MFFSELKYLSGHGSMFASFWKQNLICQAFIASSIGNLIKDIVVREVPPQVYLWYENKIWAELQWDVSRSFFFYVLPTFFLQIKCNKVWFLFPISKITLLNLTEIIDLMYRPTVGCIAFFSKMHDSWCVCMPADSFNSICKTQTAPQFSWPTGEKFLRKSMMC